MVLQESVDKGRLSRWAFIVLLLFAVAFVIHTHINTSIDPNDVNSISPIKFASRPNGRQEVDSSQQVVENPGFSSYVGQFASRVVETASADVNSVMNMFKPSEDLTQPAPFERSVGNIEVSETKTHKDLPTNADSQLSLKVIIEDNIKTTPRDTTAAQMDGRLSFLHGSTAKSQQNMPNHFQSVKPPMKEQSVKADHPDTLISQTLSFLDPVIHGHQTKKSSSLNTIDSHVSAAKHNDGRISFLDTNSAELLKQVKPSKQKKPPTLKRAQQQDEDLARIQAENNHPKISPRVGTDISLENQMSLLLCPNQAKCIIPELQLQKKLKIYLCKHPTRHGVRFYYLAREGFMLHPNVELLPESAINTADFIIYLPGSSPWHLTEVKNVSFAKRLIVLDEFDGHTLFSPGYPKEEHIKYYGGPSAPWYYMYFKRSYVRRLDGLFQGYPHLIQHEVYPLTYSIAEAYIPQHFNSKREIEILCTLRGSKSMTTRLRVQTWVSEYGKERSIQNIITGEVNTATRTTVSKQYFEQMFNAQIIVTVNPANWEGDFRLWESMCTGALIFVDPVFVPHPFPLQDKVHVVFFSNNDRDDLFRKLDYYRANPLEARKIAVQGYLHAMKYHRTVSMVDYILRTAHLRQAAMVEDNPNMLPNYSYTGQYLHYEAKVQERHIKACHQPGIFVPSAHSNEPVKRLKEDCNGAKQTLSVAVEGKSTTSNSRSSGQIEFLH